MIEKENQMLTEAYMYKILIVVRRVYIGSGENENSDC